MVDTGAVTLVWEAASRGERPELRGHRRPVRVRGKRGAKERLSAPLFRRRGVSSPPREEPVARPSEAATQVCGAGRSDQLTPSPSFVSGRSAGRTPSRLSQTFEAALGGARLDPSNRLTLPEAFCPFEDRPSGEQGSTRPVSPSREAVRGAGLNPMRPVPGSETEPPGFSAGNPGKPDTDSIVSGPRSETEGLRRPGAQSVYFSLRLAAYPTRRAPAYACLTVLESGAVWQPALVFGLPRIADTNSQLSRWEEIPCLVSEMPYRTP